MKAVWPHAAIPARLSRNRPRGDKRFFDETPFWSFRHSKLSTKLASHGRVRPQVSVRVPAVIAIALFVAVAACRQAAPGAPSAEDPPAGTPAPAGPLQQFGSGQWLVGTQIAAGRYYSQPGDGCYWERLSGLGGAFGDIIANGFHLGDLQWIVEILPGDMAFDSEVECGVWRQTAPLGAQTTIRAGMWAVGAQITPGTYTSNVQDGCYWARVRNFESTFESIVANDFITTPGQRSLTIAASDAGVESTAPCGTWARVTPLLAPESPATSESTLSNWLAHRRARGL